MSAQIPDPNRTEHGRRVAGGLRGVAEWEALAGELTAAEVAAGEALLDRLLGSPAEHRVEAQRDHTDRVEAAAERIIDTDADALRRPGDCE